MPQTYIPGQGVVNVGAGTTSGGGVITGGAIQLTPTQVLMLTPSQLQYYASIYGTDATTLIDWAEVQEGARQFNISTKQLTDQANLDYKRAIEVANINAAAAKAAAAEGNVAAQIYAEGQVRQAEIQAEAAIEAANIAAQASKYSDDIKAQIAREANELEQKRVAAIELARPGDWVARVGYMRGQTPAQTATLTQAAGGTVFGGQVPTTPALPQLGGIQPAAVVGEAGPELAQATPAGTQITPLQVEQAKWLRGAGLPGAAKGAVIGTSYNRADFAPPGQAIGETFYDPFKEERRRAYEQAYGTPIIGLPSTAAPVRRTGVTIPTRTKIVGGTPTSTSAAAGGTATPAGETTPINELPIFQYARAGGQLPVPTFQAWTGPTRNAATGVDIPPPWNYNLTQWGAMSRAEKAMLAGHWRSMMMIPGETEDELIANAYDAITRSAFRGFAPALPQWTR